MTSSCAHRQILSAPSWSIVASGANNAELPFTVVATTACPLSTPRSDIVLYWINPSHLFILLSATSDSRHLGQQRCAPQKPDLIQLLSTVGGGQATCLRTLCAGHFFCLPC